MMVIPNYRGWWVGKLCRLAGSSKPFKRVIDIDLYGPPSFVYGTVVLCYEDGTDEHVSCGNAFKPRKKDVEVKEEPELS